MTGPTRPILRYHGGKWRIAPWIISHFPEHRVYVEPFGGAGSVLLRKPRSYAEVYNDLDDNIVNLFQVTRDCGEELLRRLTLTPYARKEYILSWQPTEDPIERARRTVVRSFMGFGGAAATLSGSDTATGFRANSNRSGTTPAHDFRNFPGNTTITPGTGFRTYTSESDGRQNRHTLPQGDWPNYGSYLERIIDRLRGVVIEHRPAQQVIDAHDSDETPHYIDPPYPKSTRGDTRNDYRHEMTDGEHRELGDLLHGCRGFVAISGYACPLYDEIYSEWERVSKNTIADGALKRTETLWLNPHASRARRTMELFEEGVRG